MTQKRDVPPKRDSDHSQAFHGPSTEVSWDGGTGHQPYANRDEPQAPPAAGGEFAEGDRGELSGHNQEQLAQVRKKP